MKHLVSLSLVSGLLIGCSGGSDPQQNRLGALQETASALQVAIAPKPELPVVTRALLDGLTLPSLEAVMLDREGQTAYMIPLETRGSVRVWYTLDGSQLVLRDGIVISTRGLGADVTSSDVAPLIETLSVGAGTAARAMILTDDVDHETSLTLECNVLDLGPKTIEIVERTFAARHLQETCAGSNARFTNDYWVSRSDSRRIWLSRQWLGPTIGHVQLRLLKP